MPGRPAAENVVDIVCGNVQDGDIGPPLRQTAPQLAAVHTRHDHIGHNQINRLRGAFHDLQRLRSVGGFQRGVAFGPQGSTHQVSQAFLVIYYENDPLRLRGRLRNCRHRLAGCSGFRYMKAYPQLTTEG